DNNLRDEHELLLAFPSTSQVRYQGHADPEHLRSTELSKTVAALRDEGGSRTITTGSDRYIVAVQPVRSPGERAAFVVMHNLSASRAELQNVIGTYVVVALIAFALVTVLAS